MPNAPLELGPNPPPNYVFLSLYCDAFGEGFAPLPSARDGSAVFAALRRRRSRDFFFGEIASPPLDKVQGWLKQRAKFASSQDSQNNGVLVLYISTHGLESNGDLHLAMRDSRREKGAESMLSLSEIEALLSPFLAGMPDRRVVLLLQTCRERLAPETPGEKSLEDVWSQKPQWSVFFAARSGQPTQGTEGSYSLRDEEMGEAFGRFTRVFLDLWKDKASPSRLADLSKEVKAALEKLSEAPSFVGQEDVPWPPIRRPIQPPAEFKDRRFLPVVSGESLFGRERWLLAALGKLFDGDTERTGWLLSAKSVVCLHGPSGSGKSSLVKAGLLPRLPSSSLYADLSSQPLPILPPAPKEPLPPDQPPPFVFLDQIEGYLTESRFQKLTEFLAKAKRYSCKTILLVRSEAEPDFQRLWYCNAPKDWDIDYRVVEPLTEAEAEDVFDGSLPKDTLQSLPQDWKSQLFRSVSHAGRGGSPAFLQLALWDLFHQKKIRPLSAVWEDIWNDTIRGTLQEAKVAVVSAFCPFEEGGAWQKRRLWPKDELVAWLSSRGLENIGAAIDALVEAHWLTEGQEEGKKTLGITHDLLLPFLAERLRHDRMEQRFRGWARRLFAVLPGPKEALQTRLQEEFQPREWAKFAQRLAFWWAWVQKETAETSVEIHSKEDFEAALASLLTAQRRKRIRVLQVLAPAVLVLLLFGLGWFWKASVERRLLSAMEVCTEAPEATLPFEKFQRSSKALVSAEEGWWGGRDLKEKTVRLFEAFQAKGVPMEWWTTVPSTLEPTRRLFLSRPSPSKGGESDLAWIYLLHATLQHPSFLKFERKEIDVLLKGLGTLDLQVRRAAVGVWKAWMAKGGEPAEQERAEWLKMLTYSNTGVPRSALEVWKAWIIKGGGTTKKDRTAWTDMLKHPDSWVRRDALEVWEAWIAKKGVVSEEERAGWLKMLKGTDSWVRESALEVWKAWAANGRESTAMEKEAWLRMLEDLDYKVRAMAVGVWNAWMAKGGEPTPQERAEWLKMLKYSWMRSSVLSVWESWAAKKREPTPQEKEAWIRMLKNRDYGVRRAAVGVWKAWMAKGGEPSEQERAEWLKMLMYSNTEVRRSALGVWEAWVAKKGKPTPQERAEWLKVLKSPNANVRESALGAWKAWMAKAGEPTPQERAEWLKMLKYPDSWMRWAALEVWKAWIGKKGEGITEKERAVWTDMLKSRVYGQRHAALEVWEAWIAKKGVVPEEERAGWLKMLKGPVYGLRALVVGVWEAWMAKGGEPSEQERAEWLALLKHPDSWGRRSALGVWKAWVAKKGKPTPQERAVWLALLKDRHPGVRGGVVDVWEAWIGKGEEPTPQERAEWPKMLKDPDPGVRESALNVWSAWVAKKGESTRQERAEWLKMLKGPDTGVRNAAVRVWKAWMAKGREPSEQERAEWLKMLTYSNTGVRRSALEVWKAWIMKKGKPTPQERSPWLKMLKDHDTYIRRAVAKVWEEWIGKEGKPTQQERAKWLALLEGPDLAGHESALNVWKAWFEKGREISEKERASLIYLLKFPPLSVLHVALLVWEAWIKRGGATKQERLAWLGVLKQYGYRTDSTATAKVWQASGRVSALRLFKQEAPTAQKLEEWLTQTVAWGEVQGGIEALQERLAAAPKLARALLSSRYPIFQIAARLALAKQAVSPASRPSASSLPAPRPSALSRPLTRPASLPTSLPLPPPASRPTSAPSAPSMP